jgi:3-oxoacyl-[acyl-carrier protein] reductase
MSKHADKKRGLILGGTCELALCLSRMLIEKSFLPVLTWRTEEGRQKIDHALASHAGLYETAQLELNDPESMGALFTTTSPFEFLVDFAQGDYEALIAGSDEEKIYPYFTAYVASRAVLLKNLCRVMLRKKQGRLIYVSSSAAERPAPGQGFYGAAKLASEALYRNCGLELAGKGITAVILRAGYIDAGRGRKFLLSKPDAVRQVPLRRALKAEEVAETILFLLSPAANGINATILTMDGGLSAGKTGAFKA